MAEVAINPPSPPLNPMDTFLDDLPQPAVDIGDTIHGEVSEFHLPTLSTPLRLFQDVGPGYFFSNCGLIKRCGGKHGQLGKFLRII